MGMTQTTLDRIFDSFEQYRAATVLADQAMIDEIAAVIQANKPKLKLVWSC